jgi:ketosteroid isomerase-like protein
VTPEEAAVWQRVNAIYAGFLAGDRAAIDRNLAPDATMWDSEHEPLIRGKAELDAVRDARPTGGAAPTALEARDPVIDVLGDVAVVRHLLVATFADQPEIRVRNTSVWRRDGDEWLCAHNHEDVIG